MSLALLLVGALASRSVDVVAGESLGAESSLVERVREACAEIDVLLGPDGLPPRPRRVSVEQAPSTDAFVARTQRARFEAAAAVGWRVWLQPANVLDTLGDIEPVLRHECVHVILRARAVPPLPRADEEAVALTLSGQAARLPPATPLTPEAWVEASAALARPRDRLAYERLLARIVSTGSARVRALAATRSLVSTLRRERRLPLDAAE